MPTGMLLRSLFIATVSSNRFLLIPSLHILSFLSKPGRSYFLNADRNPVLHAILKKTFYDQFCAGETLNETTACVQSFRELGFKGFILTYAKELVMDKKTQAETGLENGVKVKKAKVADTFDKHIEEWRVGTLQTLEQIGDGDILALKTTGAGPSVTDAFTAGDLPPEQMMLALEEIATKCRERGVRIIVDAESQAFQHGIGRTTLDLMRKFNRGPKNEVLIWNTYQAYLKRTPGVLAEHLAAAQKEGFTLGLKVVRGAYILSDDRSLIHDTKQDTDDAYNAIAQGALRQEIGEFGTSRPFPAVNLLLASHNRESLLGAHRLHQQRLAANLPTVPVTYAQLHGMSDDVSFSLLQEKGADGEAPAVYKCSTWGTMGECLGYLLRRAVENRDAHTAASFTHYTACVHSASSSQRLSSQFPEQEKNGTLTISRNDNIAAATSSTTIILGVDPSQVSSTLAEPGLAAALKGKLLISVAAGWERQDIEALIPTASSTTSEKDRTWVLRTLPNIAALVSQSLIAIEDPDPAFPAHHLDTANAIFSQVGATVHIEPRHMPATTAVGGSTPAFFAIICDALIDASVAVGVPREKAQQMIYQSMMGTAAMLKSGVHPGVLRDQGTSPEGCTIAGVMVLEEGGVRGTVGRALREAVTVARLMGKEEHLNDTRHPADGSR
ncbi:pyrroline-5-carboxylate reductase [Byssothecium circinans]|uniref:Proline dehydrogenase n=1 Tax=Byssothecium circinans TaxID=147558 RepID=A0A6A5TEH7_9PLEO|nr:pyrroline-5-carboxylate reductase [Byssothecium circinans]